MRTTAQHPKPKRYNCSQTDNAIAVLYCKYIFPKKFIKNQKGTIMNGDTTRYRIKSRLALLGITQTQLLDEMAKRGFRVSHSNFSTSLRSRGTSEAQDRYLEEADKILREMESQ